MTIPVTVVRPGVPLTNAPMQYLVGANGIFLALTNKWVSATIPVAQTLPGGGWENRDKVCDIPGLKQIDTKIKWLLPPIPYEMIAQIVGFFHEVDQRMKTEVAVLLHYSDEKGWAVSVPEQEVSGGSVSYSADDRLPGYRCVGTMHSHVRMSAFHSGVDVPDEAQFDGLHCTIGKVHKYPRFDLDAEVVVRGVRAKIAANQIFQGVSTGAKYWELTGDDVEIPEEWFDKLTRKTWTTAAFDWAKYYNRGGKDENEENDNNAGSGAPYGGYNPRHGWWRED